MGFLAWGIALIVIGLLLTFSNLLGFVPGLPVLVIGLLLAAIGVVVWLLSLPGKAGRAMRRA